jgi:hypothetical protein
MDDDNVTPIRPDETVVELPQKLAGGKFAVYQTPKGGVHVSLQLDGEDEPRHIDVPPMMLKMMGGNPLLSMFGK